MRRLDNEGAQLVYRGPDGLEISEHLSNGVHRLTIALDPFWQTIEVDIGGTPILGGVWGDALPPELGLGAPTGVIRSDSSRAPRLCSKVSTKP